MTQGPTKEAQLPTGAAKRFFSTQVERHVIAMDELVRRSAEKAEAAMREVDPKYSRTQPAERNLNQVRADLPQPLKPAARDNYRRLKEFQEDCTERLARSGAAAKDVDRHKAAQELAVVIDALLPRPLTAPELVSVDEMVSSLDDHLLNPEREKDS